MTHASFPQDIDVDRAYELLRQVVIRTPLQFHKRLSEKFGAEIWIKREDLQVVRSYKLRGAYNLMHGLTAEERSRGIVAASAGNHAQGVAWSCQALGIDGVIYMPAITPRQKINQVRMFGGERIRIVLVGDTFDACQQEAQSYCREHRMTFIPPFDHPRIVEGQGTVGREILEELPDVDLIFVPIGGGGLSAGIGRFIGSRSAGVSLVGAEPLGAPSMKEAIKAGEPVTLESIERFVDGAAVKRVGDVTFPLCREALSDVVLVPEGKVCSTILRLYNEDAIVAEPAGVLSIAALDFYPGALAGKRIVCVLSGGNNDIDRMQEIKERSLLYEGLKHYFIVRFAQRPGALREFVNDILGPTDDIVRFEFIQKHNKENGPALIGIEVKNREDCQTLMDRMQSHDLNFTLVNQDENLFEYLV